MENIFPPITVDLDKVRTLRVDFNALSDFEEQGNRSIMDVTSWTNMSSSDLRLMLALSLRHEDPTMTPKKAGKLLHRGNLEYVLGRVTKAWTSQLASGDAASPLEVLATV